MGTSASAPTESRVASIESLDARGQGVAHAGGKAVFVDGALPGEVVRYERVRSKPSYETARIVAIHRSSAARVTPKCPHFGRCGGCVLQHADMSLQVAAKQRTLEDTLWHIGRVNPEMMLAPIVGPSWGYRNRARLAVRFVEKKGGVLVGFHERRSTFIADMSECHVLPQHLARLIVPLRALIGSLSVARRLPQIEVAVGDRVTVLVLRVLDALTGPDESAIRAFAQAHGVQIWLQPKGPETARAFHPLEAPQLDYELADYGLRIEFAPNDFTQVNHGVNIELVRRAVGLLGPRPGERILDLFCGLGNFSLPIARSGAQVIGYEGSRPLVQRATENARRNGLAARFEVADLFDANQVPSLAHVDKLLIDPPREGAIEVVKALPEADPPGRIVYVSCDPATLARDAGMLVRSKGYRLVAAGIANMFPHTAHVESIAAFER